MSKVTTDQADFSPENWGPAVELAPSILRDDEPTLARWVGMAGAFFVVFGGAALLFNAVGWNARIGVGWGTLLMVFGLAAMLFHASFDHDLQIRRLYWGVGMALFVLGALLGFLPLRGPIGSMFGLGYPCLGVGLVFLVATNRLETDPFFRGLTLKVLGIAGAAMSLSALVLGNNIFGEFMLPYGVLLALMGLAYLSAFVSRQGIASDLGYQVAIGIGILGVAALVMGLVRSLPGLLFFLGISNNRPADYFIPYGILFLALGTLYTLISLGLWSDNRLVVLTRRELANFFFSPMAYMVLIGLTIVAWWRFGEFVVLLTRPLRSNEVGVLEPIVYIYILSWWTVISVIFLIPVLTMRLLSEEWRTGTLEVLLTAPVSERAVVLSKFFACLITFLIVWVPWGLFLIALRLIGGKPFDYQPLLSFFLVLACTGAGFIAMGMFFSSLTRNQIASAVLTFAAMLGFTILFFVKQTLETRTPGADANPWVTVLSHMSYVDVWFNALQGVIVPRQLLFHLSAAVLWLFMTIKVLESRKWS